MFHSREDMPLCCVCRCPVHTAVVPSICIMTSGLPTPCPLSATWEWSTPFLCVPHHSDMRKKKAHLFSFICQTRLAGRTLSSDSRGRLISMLCLPAVGFDAVTFGVLWVTPVHFRTTCSLSRFKQEQPFPSLVSPNGECWRALSSTAKPWLSTM